MFSKGLFKRQQEEQKPASQGFLGFIAILIKKEKPPLPNSCYLSAGGKSTNGNVLLLFCLSFMLISVRVKSCNDRNKD